MLTVAKELKEDQREQPNQLEKNTKSGNEVIVVQQKRGRWDDDSDSDDNKKKKKVKIKKSNFKKMKGS